MLASSFFFTNTASTMPSTLSLHDALPIFLEQQRLCLVGDDDRLEVGDLRHQRRPLRRGAAVGTEVARHPGAQALRLAHVEGLTGRALPEVHPGLVGEGV